MKPIGYTCECLVSEMIHTLSIVILVVFKVNYLRLKEDSFMIFDNGSLKKGAGPQSEFCSEDVSRDQL